MHSITLAMLATLAATQDVPVTAAATTEPSIAAAETPAPVTTVLLPRDTPVELMAPSEVSTARATAGTIFKLRVNKPVEIDGRVIIPVGTTGYGEVLSAESSGGLGKKGAMSARLVRIQLGDANIPIEGRVDATGRGAGSAGAAVLLGGIVGLFHRGNNAKIKAGEVLMGFTSEDVTLDLSAPAARRVDVPKVAAAQ